MSRNGWAHHLDVVVQMPGCEATRGNNGPKGYGTLGIAALIEALMRVKRQFRIANEFHPNIPSERSGTAVQGSTDAVWLIGSH